MAFVFQINISLLDKNMNIQELQSFNLADAAKFHFRLNPKIWGKDENLLPEVKQNLLEIAEDFREFLGIPELDIKDITISGSNAAYSYTDKSDIDLHLVVEFPAGKQSEIYRELFDAKKFQYNELHDYKIGNADVELYVQDIAQPHASQGIYSLLGNKWLSVPRRIKAEIDHSEVKNKYEDFGHRIERAIDSGDIDVQKKTLERLKSMRQTGLESNGEFGAENLAFKMLRNSGLIQQLWDAYYKSKSDKLSLEEKLKEKVKKPFVYGYTEDVSHNENGVSASTCMDLSETDVEEDVSHNPDGVSASTTMTLNENNPEDVLNQFMNFCVDKLKIKNTPKLKLRRDPQWSKVNKTFGRFNPETGLLEVSWGKRHLMDVLRTVAHELTHQRQYEREDVPPNAGETGSEWENEANARAGILMRLWGQEYPNLFDGDVIQDEIDEGSLKNTAAALALGTTLGLGSPAAQGQSIGDVIGAVQNIGTAARTASNMTRAGINAEMSQELFNYIRAQGGDPHGQNQSTLYQWQKRMEQDTRARQQDRQPASTDYIGDFRTDNPKPARARKMPDRGRGEGYIIGDSIQESASGYIPTKKQAHDPRYEMALTQDIKPGQLGKEANKLKLKTNKQGIPQVARANGLVEALALQLAQFKKRGTIVESVLDEEELDEVNMSPSSLKKFAQSDVAKGMLAGFELEVCIPDTSVEDDDYDMEPDYDMDERAYSISGVVDFFQGGDYGISERQGERLSEQLYESFAEWSSEQAYENWRGDEGREFFEERARNDWETDGTWDEKVREVLMSDIDTGNDLFNTSEEEMTKNLDRVIQAGKDAPRFTRLQDQVTYAKENPEYQLYLDADNAVDELFQEFVEEEWTKADSRLYNDSQEEFVQDQMDNLDAEEWFDSADLRWMSDVANSYDLEWPYMTGGGNGGENTIEQRAESLSQALGMPVEASTGYHSARRTNDKFILEPDSSIETDNREDAGLELVSPPLPVEECIEKLKAAIQWCQDNACYTNSSTGLHMGVSLPSQSTKDLDYVKLALFLGDEYVLKSFGREANTYTKAAIKDIKNKVKGRGEEDISTLLGRIRSGLSDVASKAIASTSPGKYSSINIKDGYVEFRSAGGDTLSRESDEGTDFLENTLYRYVQAMAIAGNPESEKKEYAKKLYKLIAPEGGDQTLALFSKFAAGDIDKETLKTKWAEAVINKEKPELPGNWELVNKQTGERDWSGQNMYRQEAEQKAKEEVGSRNLDKYVLRKMIAPHEFKQWDYYNIDTEEVIDTVRAQSREEAWDYFTDKFKDRPDAAKFGIQPHKPTDSEVEPAPKLSKKAELAQQIKSKSDIEKLKPKQETSSNGVPMWEVYEIETGHVVHTFADHSQKEAEIAKDSWLKSIGAEQPALFSVRAKMTNPGQSQTYSSYADAQRAAEQQNQQSSSTESSGQRFNYEIYNRDNPNQPVRRFYASNHPDAMAELENYRRTASFAPNQYVLRNL